MEPIVDTNAIHTLISTGTEGVFFVAALIFVFFTLSIAYHWFTYGLSKSHTMLALSVYLIVGSTLLLLTSWSLATF